MDTQLRDTLAKLDGDKLEQLGLQQLGHQVSRRLQNQLEGTNILRFDDRTGLFLSWKGGHGIHAYNMDGDEVAFWNVGDFANTHASPDVVLDSMQDKLDADVPYEVHAV